VSRLDQGCGFEVLDILIGVLAGTSQAFLHCIHFGMHICWALPPFWALQML
jgi:hypothetical protein